MINTDRLFSYRLADISADAMMQIRLLSDVISRTFARMSRWANLLLTDMNFTYLRMLPAIGLSLSLSSLFLRSFQKFIQPNVSLEIKSFYIGSLLSLALLNTAAFSITGTFSFLFLAFTTAVVRLIVDGADLYINDKKYQKLCLEFKHIEKDYLDKKAELALKIEARDNLICEMVILSKALCDEKPKPTALYLIHQSAIELEKLNLAIKAIEVPYLQKKEALEKARAQRNNGITMTAFSFLCSAVLLIPVIASLTNPLLALSLLISFEILECLAISTIALRLFTLRQKEVPAETFYEAATNENKAALEKASTKTLANEPSLKEKLESGESLPKETLESIKAQKEISPKMRALTDKTSAKPQKNNPFAFFLSQKDTVAEANYKASINPKMA